MTTNIIIYKMFKILNKATIILVTTFSFIPQKSNSQSILYQTIERNKVDFEWIKPNYSEQLDQNDKITFFSSVLFISGKYSLSNQISFLLDIPISHWEFKDGDGIDVQAPHTTIGNIYVGGEVTFPVIYKTIIPSVELGTRIPTMPTPDFPDKRGYFSGYITEIDRREAFVDGIVPLVGFVNLDYHVNQIIILRFKGGGFYWVNTKNSPIRKNRLYFSNSFQVHFTTKEIGGYMGITSKYNMEASPSLVLPGDNIAQLWMGLSKSFGKWRPELYTRAYMEDTYLLSSVVGLKLTRNF